MRYDLRLNLIGTGRFRDDCCDGDVQGVKTMLSGSEVKSADCPLRGPEFNNHIVAHNRL